MKKMALFIGFLMVSNFAYAESVEMQIKGMTCGACVASVKKKLCSLPQIDKCDVEVGKANILLKSGQKIEDSALSEAIKTAGFTLEKTTHKEK